MSDVKVETIDELVDTRITISCYRETSRLDRMLTVFQRALNLADRACQAHRLREGLLELHDCKGFLTVTWLNEDFYRECKGFVEKAWEDHCEHEIAHVRKPGKDDDPFASTVPIRDDRPKSFDNWTTIGDLSVNILGRREELFQAVSETTDPKCDHHTNEQA
jgi:hypothetical protein